MVPMAIEPNYLSDPCDSEVSVWLFRLMRALMAQAPLQAHVDGESFPGEAVQSDDEILDYCRRRGMSGQHATGTCRMGVGDGAVLNEQLRVRAAHGLRVMDASVMPSMVSGNTNGPAMAWRASELLLGNRPR